MAVFKYRAERYDGTAASGTVDAVDIGTAEHQLAAMGLRVFDLSANASPVKTVRLGPGDLQTFNEFLMQISSAGVPLEQGLALLSGELRSSKLKTSIDALVRDLESGQPINHAMATRRDSFPPLYGRLIDAGIQSANLPGVLQQFGRHMDDMAELRNSLWRACAYPAVVFFAMLLLLIFLGYWLLPAYFTSIQNIVFKVFDMQSMQLVSIPINIPLAAIAILYLGKIAPLLLLASVAMATMACLAVRAARSGRGNRRWLDRIVLRLPLVGRAVRDSYLASWLDVMSIGIDAGLDLPRAIRVAGDAVALPSLKIDGDAICARIEAGQDAGGATVSRLPLTVPLAIDMAQGNTHLPQSFAALAMQYREQAQRQIRLIPGRIMPALLIIIGLLAGGIMYSLWMPMAELLRAMGMGGRY